MCFKENIGCKYDDKKNESKKLTKDISNKCTCKFDGRTFYSN